MSDQINEQAEKMREMAQTTLDKAKDAVSKYIAESQKMREKADSGVRATYSNVKEMNDKAVAYAEANVAAGFELAERLLQGERPAGNGHHLSKSSERADGKDDRAVPRTRKSDQQTAAGRSEQVNSRPGGNSCSTAPIRR